MGDAVAGASERVGDVGPGVDTATSAGFDDAEFSGIGGAAFFGSRSEAEAPGDDGQAQGALGLVVGWRQGMVGDEGDDGAPVVEDFPGKRTDFLGLVIAVELAGPFQASLDRVEEGMVLVLSDGLDQAAQFADQPLAEADAVRMQATGQGDSFADQMSDAALAAGVVAIGTVPIGDQPAEDGVPEQVADFLVAAAADMEDGGGGTQHHPQPASEHALPPRGLVGMNDAGGPHLFEQIFDDRLACARRSWRDPAGGSPARVGSSSRPVARVAGSSATATAKRTQRDDEDCI